MVQTGTSIKPSFTLDDKDNPVTSKTWFELAQKDNDEVRRDYFKIPFNEPYCTCSKCMEARDRHSPELPCKIDDPLFTAKLYRIAFTRGITRPEIATREDAIEIFNSLTFNGVMNQYSDLQRLNKMTAPMLKKALEPKLERFQADSKMYLGLAKLLYIASWKVDYMTLQRASDSWYLLHESQPGTDTPTMAHFREMNKILRDSFFDMMTDLLLWSLLPVEEKVQLDRLELFNNHFNVPLAHSFNYGSKAFPWIESFIYNYRMVCEAIWVFASSPADLKEWRIIYPKLQTLRGNLKAMKMPVNIIPIVQKTFKCDVCNTKIFRLGPTNRLYPATIGLSRHSDAYPREVLKLDRPHSTILEPPQLLKFRRSIVNVCSPACLLHIEKFKYPFLAEFFKAFADTQGVAGLLGSNSLLVKFNQFKPTSNATNNISKEQTILLRYLKEFRNVYHMGILLSELPLKINVQKPWTVHPFYGIDNVINHLKTSALQGTPLEVIVPEDPKRDRFVKMLQVLPEKKVAKRDYSAGCAATYRRVIADELGCLCKTHKKVASTRLRWDQKWWANTKYPEMDVIFNAHVCNQFERLQPVDSAKDIRSMIEFTFNNGQVFVVIPIEEQYIRHSDLSMGVKFLAELPKRDHSRMVQVLTSLQCTYMMFVQNLNPIGQTCEGGVLFHDKGTDKFVGILMTNLYKFIMDEVLLKIFFMAFSDYKDSGFKGIKMDFSGFRAQPLSAFNHQCYTFSDYLPISKLAEIRKKREFCLCVSVVSFNLRNRHLEDFRKPAIKLHLPNDMKLFEFTFKLDIHDLTRSNNGCDRWEETVVLLKNYVHQETTLGSIVNRINEMLGFQPNEEKGKPKVMYHYVSGGKRFPAFGSSTVRHLLADSSAEKTMHVVFQSDFKFFLPIPRIEFWNYCGLVRVKLTYIDSNSEDSVRLQVFVPISITMYEIPRTYSPFGHEDNMTVFLQHTRDEALERHITLQDVVDEFDLDIQDPIQLLVSKCDLEVEEYPGEFCQKLDTMNPFFLMQASSLSPSLAHFQACQHRALWTGDVRIVNFSEVHTPQLSYHPYVNVCISTCRDLEEFGATKMFADHNRPMAMAVVRSKAFVQKFTGYKELDDAQKLYLDFGCELDSQFLPLLERFLLVLQAPDSVVLGTYLVKKDKASPSQSFFIVKYEKKEDRTFACIGYFPKNKKRFDKEIEDWMKKNEDHTPILRELDIHNQFRQSLMNLRSGFPIESGRILWSGTVQRVPAKKKMGKPFIHTDRMLAIASTEPPPDLRCFQNGDVFIKNLVFFPISSDILEQVTPSRWKEAFKVKLYFLHMPDMVKYIEESNGEPRLRYVVAFPGTVPLLSQYRNRDFEIKKDTLLVLDTERCKVTQRPEITGYFFKNRTRAKVILTLVKKDETMRLVPDRYPACLDPDQYPFEDAIDKPETDMLGLPDARNETPNDLPVFMGEQDHLEPQQNLTQRNNAKENKGSKRPSENRTEERLDEAKKKKKKKDQKKSNVQRENDMKIKSFLSTLDSSLKKIENNSPSTNGLRPVKCSRCKKDLQDIKRCGACNLVPYCGLECLRKDREAHKRSCGEKQMQFYRENISPVVEELLEATK